MTVEDGQEEEKEWEVRREDSCPETTTTDGRDVGDLAAEEVSVALYPNMAHTHVVALVLG